MFLEPHTPLLLLQPRPTGLLLSLLFAGLDAEEVDRSLPEDPALSGLGRMHC